MPHTWAQIFPRWPQSIRCFENWAQICRQLGEGGGVGKESRGRPIRFEDLGTEDLDVQALTPLTPVKASMLMKEACKGKQPFTGHKDLKASL